MAEVIQLPSGLRLPVPDGVHPVTIYVRHGAAATAEGLCPDHGTALDPEVRLPGPGGYCARCRAWRYSTPDADLTTHADYAFAPDGSPISHQWMSHHGRPALTFKLTVNPVHRRLGLA